MLLQDAARLALETDVALRLSHEATETEHFATSDLHIDL
jgi:hypothetical protein